MHFLILSLWVDVYKTVLHVYKFCVNDVFWRLSQQLAFFFWHYVYEIHESGSQAFLIEGQIVIILGFVGHV